MSAGEKEKKWYFRTWTIVVLILFIGPFGLPLLWINPYYSRKSKILVSLLILVFSYLLGLLVAWALKSLMAYYKELGIF